MPMAANNSKSVATPGNAQAKKAKPDLVCTTNTTPNSVVDVKVAKQITITYRFYPALYTGLIFEPEGHGVSTDSKKLTGLPIVFGYVKNGVVDPCSGTALVTIPKPEKLNMSPKGKAKNPKKGRQDVEIERHVMPIKNVSSGKPFGLYLGCDTKPKYRKHVLYEVTPGENDVVIDVYETYGKYTASADIKFVGTKKADATTKFLETRKEGNQEIDYYEANLTGDIWKSISHVYVEKDVDDMLNVKLPSEAVAAIKKIYKGEVDEKGGRLSLTITFADKKTLKLSWNGGTENAKANISSIRTKSEILSRVQPKTYAAMIKAAMDAAVDEITISSGWRPMVGSVIHRLGLGLDVTYVKHSAKNHHVSREYGRANENLSEDEKDAYKDVREKKDALRAAKKAKKSDKEIKALAAELKAAELTLLEETKTAPTTTDPKPVKDFRKALLALKEVRHVYDPWYIDHDAGDGVDPKVNELGHNDKNADSALEHLHRHHLHITAADSELGFARGNK